jgi:hypothetical protein
MGSILLSFSTFFLGYNAMAYLFKKSGECSLQAAFCKLKLALQSGFTPEY